MAVTTVSYKNFTLIEDPSNPGNPDSDTSGSGGDLIQDNFKWTADNMVPSGGGTFAGNVSFSNKIALGNVTPTSRITIESNTAASGGILFGEANFYRSAANTLKTDTALVVGTSLSANNIISTVAVSGANLYATTSISGANAFVANGVIATDFYGKGSGVTNLNADNISLGTVSTARLGTGTANSATFLRGDGTWNAPPGATVSSVAGKTGAVTLQSADITDATDAGNANTLAKRDSAGRIGFAKVSITSGTTNANGIDFGSDTNLYRLAADTLKTDDSILVAGRIGVNTSVPSGQIQVVSSGVSATQMILQSASAQTAKVLDVRDSTGSPTSWIKPDGKIFTQAGLCVGNSTGTSPPTSGTPAGAFEVFNANGVSLGWVPYYSL